MDYSKIRVSLFDGLNKPSKERVELMKILTSDIFRGKVEKVRAAEYHSIRQKELKEKLPVFSMGIFEGMRKAENLKKAVPLIALDFDRNDNDTDINKPNMIFRAFKHAIKNDPFVLYCGLSCSGYGWRLILPITSNEKEQRTRQYLAAERYFLKRYGMKADSACKDIARAFFVSYDDDPYINQRAKAFPFFVDEAKPIQAATIKQGSVADAVALIRHIEKAEKSNILAFDDYNEWVTMGLAVASTFGEDGRYLFHRLSALSPKYDKASADEKYNDLLTSTPSGNAATIGSIYWQLKQADTKNDFNNINIDDDEEYL